MAEKIIGHAEQMNNLRRLLRENRLPHALLFSGPVGVGKSLAAQSLLRDFLCLNHNSCGACPSCRAFAAGTHGDYHVILPEVSPGGKRTIKIEAIRALQSELAKFPQISEGRAVLIDEAETMNEAAMNCLLKTLEEPAGQTLFILVVGAKSALLPTIISRCTRISFGTLKAEEIEAELVRRGSGGDEAKQLARLSDGSLGRALALATEDTFILEREAGSFLAELPRLDMVAVWDKCERLDKLGKDKLTEWLRYVSFYLRDVLVKKISPGEKAGEFFYHETLPAVNLSASALFALLRLAQETQRRLSANVNLRLQLESFMIRARDAVS